MGNARLRGDAPPKSRIMRIVPASVEVGDTFQVHVPDAVNGKTVSYVAEAATVEDVVNGLVTAINETELAEFQELTATAVDTDEDGTVDAVDVEGPEDVWWDLSTSTTNTSGGNVSVVETVKGAEGTDETQKIELVGTYTGGTFTLTIDLGAGNETTAAIAYNATAADIKNALEGLASVNPGDVVVTGGPGPSTAWFVTFTGQHSATNVNKFSIDGTNLIGTSGLTIETVTQGSGKSDDLQYLHHRSTAGSYTLELSGQMTASINAAATAAQIQTALEALPNVGSGNVEVKGGYTSNEPADPTTVAHLATYLIHFIGALAETNMPTLIMDTSGLIDPTGAGVDPIQAGGQTSSDEYQWLDLGGATGGTITLTFEGDTTTQIAWNKVGDSSNTVRDALIAASSSLSAGDLNSPRQWAEGIGELLRFVGSKSNTNVSELAMGTGGLTGATSPGVTTIKEGGGNTNEVQKVRVYATGGTFTLTFDGQTTVATAFNALASTLETNLEALSNVTDVTVTGSGTHDDPWVVTFVDPGAQNVAEMTGDATSLNGGGGGVTENPQGSAGTNEVQTVTIGAGVTGGTFTLSFGGVTTNAIASNASAATVETELEALATIDGISVSGSAGGPYTITFDVVPLNNTDVELLVADGSNLVGGSGTETLSVSVTQESAGPRHFNDPNNWVGGAVPDSADDLFLEDNTVDLLYGLRQRDTFTVDAGTDMITVASGKHDFRHNQQLRVSSTGTLPAGLTANTNLFAINVDREAGTLQLSTVADGSPIDITDTGTGTHTIGLRANSVIRASTFTGEIGLPNKNENGYWEYRPTALAIGLAADGDKTVRIGDGAGSGSNLNRFDFGPDERILRVRKTGSGQNGVPALLITGDHTSNSQEIVEGDVGFAFYPGDVAVLNGLTQRGGRVVMGKGATVNGRVDRTGGTLIANATTFNNAEFEWS